MFLYFNDKSHSRNKLDAVLRLISRIEAVIHDNITITLSDSTKLFNNRVENTTLDATEDSENYVVQFVFQGQHLANTA